MKLELTKMFRTDVEVPNSVTEVAKMLIHEHAGDRGCVETSTHFNGVLVAYRPGMLVQDILAGYHHECNRMGVPILESVAETEAQLVHLHRRHTRVVPR